MTIEPYRQCFESLLCGGLAEVKHLNICVPTTRDENLLSGVELQTRDFIKVIIECADDWMTYNCIWVKFHSIWVTLGQHPIHIQNLREKFPSPNSRMRHLHSPIYLVRVFENQNKPDVELAKSKKIYCTCLNGSIYTPRRNQISVHGEGSSTTLVLVAGDICSLVHGWFGSTRLRLSLKLQVQSRAQCVLQAIQWSLHL